MAPSKLLTTVNKNICSCICGKQRRLKLICLYLNALGGGGDGA